MKDALVLSKPDAIDLGSLIAEVSRLYRKESPQASLDWIKGHPDTGVRQVLYHAQACMAECVSDALVKDFTKRMGRVA